MTTFCHPYRVKINELVNDVYNDIYKDICPPGTSKTCPSEKKTKTTIANILTKPNSEPRSLKDSAYKKLGVNHYKDKVSKLAKEKGFTAKGSISEAEVSRFVYQVVRFGKFDNKKDPKAIIAKSLHKIFFGDKPVFETGPDITKNAIDGFELSTVKFYGKCYDGDTCKISVFKPYECFKKGLWGFYGSARESQIDAAEKGIIADTAKDWVIGRLNNPKFNGKKKGYIKVKLVDNCIKIFKEIVGKVKVNKDEAFTAIKLISAWVNYSASIDKEVMNGFINYVQDENKIMLETKESSIRYTSKNTPKEVCGMLLQYDTYLRRLTLYFVEDGKKINGLPPIQAFLKYEFPKVIENYEKGHFAEHFENVKELSNKLAKSKNKKMAGFAKMLSEKNLKKPTEIYSKYRMKKIITGMKTLFEKHPEYSNCWTLTKVLLGLEYDYQKYRGPDYPVFEKAGVIARLAKAGLWWSDPTFNALWQYHSKIPRYHPKDCMTGK